MIAGDRGGRHLIRFARLLQRFEAMSESFKGGGDQCREISCDPSLKQRFRNPADLQYGEFAAGKPDSLIAIDLDIEEPGRRNGQRRGFVFGARPRVNGRNTVAGDLNFNGSISVESSGVYRCNHYWMTLEVPAVACDSINGRRCSQLG